jgi:hypothetical protein
VSLGRLLHIHWVAAEQVRQAPATQALPQQAPPTHEPDWHSAPVPQAVPAGFFTQAPATQVMPPPHALPLVTLPQVHIVAAVH